jgi:hypothetical protein
MLRPKCRHVLGVGGTRMPRAELACCMVGCDGELMAARSGRAALRPMSEPDARACRQLVRLHGMGTGAPRVVAEEFTCRGRAMWYGLHLGRRWRVLVRTSCLSCKAETGRAKWISVVQGEDWSCEASSSRELVGEAPN